MKIVYKDVAIHLDSILEAAALLEQLTSKATKVAKIKQPTKAKSHKKYHKTFSLWTKDEVKIILKHLDEKARQAQKYLPNHTVASVSAVKTSLRTGRYLSEKIIRILKELQKEDNRDWPENPYLPASLHSSFNFHDKNGEYQY